MVRRERFDFLTALHRAAVILAHQVDRADRRLSAATSGRADNAGTCGEGGHPRPARRHDGEVRPWKRRLSDGECSVLLAELLLRHPELAAEAAEITSTLLVVENEQELGDEITAKLRALRANGPVSVDAGRGRVLDVLQPYIDDLTLRKERGARRAAADIAIAVLSGLYECREDTEEDMLLVRMGLPGSADDLARMVYKKVKPLHLSLPSLADECPEWEWYEQS
jgi:hypothetical protein